MIPTKILSAVTFFGAIFLTSTAATSLPSHSIDNQCYKCPEKIVDHKDVPFHFVKEVRSREYLECYYVNKKDTKEQTFCIYKIDDGLLSTNGDGFCPEKANKEHDGSCGATPRS